MGERTFKSITCDAPFHNNDSEEMFGPKEINPDRPFINAMTYGACFHVECYKKMTAHELLRALGLDEVKLLPRDGDWSEAKKIYSLKTF